MNCQQTLDLIDALPFSDDPMQQRRIIEIHTQTCTSCQEAFQRALQIEKELQSLQEPTSRPLIFTDEDLDLPTKSQPETSWMPSLSIIAAALLLLLTQTQTLWQQFGTNVLQPVSYRLAQDGFQTLKGSPILWLMTVFTTTLAIFILKPKRPDF